MIQGAWPHLHGCVCWGGGVGYAELLLTHTHTHTPLLPSYGVCVDVKMQDLSLIKSSCFPAGSHTSPSIGVK